MQWAEAEAMFTAAIARDPGSGRALFRLMQAREGEGHDMEAREAYR